MKHLQEFIDLQAYLDFQWDTLKLEYFLYYAIVLYL